MTIKDLNPTTRCYPRTMREAFPFDYPAMFEHYKRPRNNNYVVWILASIAIIGISIAIKVIY